MYSYNYHFSVIQKFLELTFANCLKHSKTITLILVVEKEAGKKHYKYL